MLPFVFALYPVALSGIALVWLCRAKRQSRLLWAIQALACGGIIAFLFMAGPWVFTSYYLRYAVLALYVFGLAFSYRRMRLSERPAAAAPKARRLVFPALVLILFCVLTAFAAGARHGPEQSLDLSFPLGSGTYAALQGGGSVVTNPFHALSGSQYAVDLVKLNAFGNRADGIAPRDLDAYEIFGEGLHSPCRGTVLAVRDGLPDNAPREIDLERPEGNHIVLECADARVLMAHLRQDSLRVAPGETVSSGQLLGQIGNSGNTSEPHLHIEATQGGAGVPLRFDGRWLSVNSLVRVGPTARWGAIERRAPPRPQARMR